MIIKVSKDGFIDLKEFKNVLDISKVSYYDLKESGRVLTLKFYDKDNKIISLQEKRNEKVKKASKNKD